MKVFSSRWIRCAALSLSLLPLAVGAQEWDPDDATFDPEVKSVIANGSTRLGDPSPFVQKGIDIVAYTHVGPQEDPSRGTVVAVSLIVPLLPGETAPRGGGALFLETDDAARLSAALRTGADRLDSGEAGDGDVLETFPGFSGKKEWTVTFEGDHLTFLHQSGDSESVYQFKPNPARKLAGAIDHTISVIEEKS